MILMFGDVHGDFRHVLPAVEAEKPKAIIFLGDLQAQRPLEEELASVLDKTEVWWIHGNHDTDSRKDYSNLFESKLADRNLHGRIVEIDGLRVAGLGGIFRESAWYPQHSAEAEPRHPDYDSLINAELEAERWKEYRRQKTAGQEPGDLRMPRRTTVPSSTNSLRITRRGQTTSSAVRSMPITMRSCGRQISISTSK